MRLRFIGMAALVISFLSTGAEARVIRLSIERREKVLNGRSFGPAGGYEKLVGKAEFALDPPGDQ